MTDLNKLTEIIENHNDPEPFSGVVYLSRGIDVLYERGFGYAIQTEAIPNRINTRFQMASGCKVFTATAICKLVEMNKLALDSHLCDIVDNVFPNYAPEITIRHLLIHSSGIRSYFEEDINPDYEALWRDWPVYKVRSPEDFLPLFQNKPMKFEPGERFDYNDGGYILLGLVIESVTGMRFTEFIKKMIFEPARMKDSGYFAMDQLPERTAYAYIKNGDGTWRTNFFAVPIIGAPDGGAYTTAPDLFRFWRALTGKKLLELEMTGLLLNSQISTSWDPPYSHYGYGVWIDQLDGEVRKMFVEGFDPGVALRSAIFPRSGHIVTVIGNTGRALWPLFNELEKYLGL